ncbi:MAG: UDP-N-acetylglucosamine 1-carboxyvinyltransferase [Oscillospiraceae bacterium]|nr:UDP-N-acetylglucosamine 1-carboxyvinyltransferase [Oscillospiraceae bacterium]
MDKFVIEGGKRLKGDIYVSGAKNSVVALLPATLLLDVPCVIENVPDISDVEICLTILRELGASVEKLREGTYRISTLDVTSTEVPAELARKMRASYYFLGALLGRSHRAVAAMPGGCNLGERPIDQHLLAFEALGAETTLIKKIDNDGTAYIDAVELKAEHLYGSNISLNVVSVGATMNAILAAVKAEGITVIENCAREPHIVDLANFLNYMGAHISGAGTHKITIEGTPVLLGNDALEGSVEERIYSVVPDQIEAGTFMVAAAATRGDVLIHGVIPHHMKDIAERLQECGVTVEEVESADRQEVCIRVSVSENRRLHPTNIKTEPYPGFPTDMQPQMAALLCIVDGQSNISEQVWEDRFRYVAELRRMGAHINTTHDGAIIFGVPGLHGARVKACDLRAGAAMIIAGLAAEGTTEITDIYHIERGYSHIVDKLRGIGADMKWISE